MIDRKKFYDTVRENLFGGKMTAKQVEGMEAILMEWDRRSMLDVRQLAYILATAYHEVAKTMQPIEEYGKGKNRAYGHKVKYKGHQPYDTPDKLYYGRGLVQLTWYENYDKMTTAAKRQGYVNWDFLNNPELLLQIVPSVFVAYEGMIKGMFTGRKLLDYFNADTEDWVNARRIINRLDRAEDIAGYAKLFLNALI